MRTNYKIRNFRAFDEGGATVKIAPITILTGCNSSGKSSIVKSILLLDTFLSKLKKEDKGKTVFDFDQYTLDFNKYPLNLLGRFDKVVNSLSSSKDIIFEYEVDDDFTIQLTFCPRPEDKLNRGYLKKLVILKNEQSVYSTDRGACYLNMFPFRDDYLISTQKLLKSGNSIFQGFDSIEYQHNHKVSEKTLSWAIKNDSLFNIPLLSKIGEFNKENFLIEIKKELSNNWEDNNGLTLIIQRLAEVFANSEFETFKDFFVNREKEWLQSLSNSHEVAFDDISDDNDRVPKDWSHVFTKSSYSEEAWRILIHNLSKGEKKWLDRLEKTSFKFPWLVTILTHLGYLIGLSLDEEYAQRETFLKYEEWMSRDKDHRYIFYLWEDFKNHVERKLKRSILPSWSNQLSYVGSSRIDVKRLYTLDAKNDFALLLNKYFNARRDFIGLHKYENEEGYEPDAFLNKWLSRFGICDYATIDMDVEGLGITIKLHKGDKTTLLADEGYGITQLFSILLEIESAIQNAFHYFLVKNWFGQNYVYNVNMNTNKVEFPEQTILIEEPEIHLHPKYQSMLTDMFIEAYELYNIHFIIETHSEYLIRRLQIKVADKKIPSKDVSVIYVDEGSHPYDMCLKDNGKFKENFGPGFFDEADNAAIQLFELSEE